MRSAFVALLFVASPRLAAAVEIRPVHSVGTAVYVEMGDDPSEREANAGPIRTFEIQGSRGFARALQVAPDEGRPVRLVGSDGTCDGTLRREVLLGLYDPGQEPPIAGPGSPARARWMVAARVAHCRGEFLVAVLDPPDHASPVAPLGPDDEEADAAARAAHAALVRSVGLARARADWLALGGGLPRERTTAWRVGSFAYAAAEAVFDGSSCGPADALRTIVRIDRQGRTRVVLPVEAAGDAEEIRAITDLDGDGEPEVIARAPFDRVRVLRLRGGRRPEVLLDGGGIPSFDCSP